MTAGVVEFETYVILPDGRRTGPHDAYRAQCNDVVCAVDSPYPRWRGPTHIVEMERRARANAVGDALEHNRLAHEWLRR
jgi:hypothetical protein